MGSMGNAFVACGVIYCINSYNARSTTINFAYDTKTGQQWNPNIQFTNQYMQLQLHGGLQPKGKSVVRLGQQVSGYLSNHL